MLHATTDANEWNALKGDIDDVYWSWEHLARWASVEGGRPVGLVWTSPSNRCALPLIQIPLDALPGGEGLSDVRSAYDFGGPRFGTAPSPEEILAFRADYTSWLTEERVVTEFMRLHPVVHQVTHPFAEQHGQHHIIDLSDGLEAARAGYSRSFRRNLRKGLRSGLRGFFVADPTPEQAERFIALYNGTMERVGASVLYQFADAALNGLLRAPETHLVLVEWEGEIVAASIALRSGPGLMYHLTGSAARSPNAGELIIDTTAELAARLGCDWVHLGGGAPSLSEFKARAANAQVPYFIVKRVVQPDAYQRLCAALGLDSAQGGFPAYYPLPG
ncbi:MAG: hypothetical protein CMH57_02395 [Myxococcales bacterium]|nr:hypothetical protein [Myxococcales bacterium]